MVAYDGNSLKIRPSSHLSQHVRRSCVTNTRHIVRVAVTGFLVLYCSTLAHAQAVPRDTGEVVYQDAKSRATCERNLHPLPSGCTRLAGLFVTQDMQGSVGPGGNMYSAVTFRFYYFLPNGYAYKGAKEAGLESLQCARPRVNSYDYLSVGAAAAVSSSFTFSRDSRFDGSNVTSVMVDTDPTNSGQTGGARVGVTGSSSAK